MIIEFITKKFAHFNLIDEEIYELSKILTFQKFRKKEYVFFPGARVNKIALIVKGSVYSSILDIEGSFRITSFHYPSSYGEIVFNYEDYLEDVHSKKVFQAYEDSLLLFLDIVAVKKLYERFPRFYQLELTIMEGNFFLALKNIRILQSKNAAEKIILFKEMYPHVFQIFPYSYISSYLGIHRNTFNKVISSI